MTTTMIVSAGVAPMQSEARAGSEQLSQRVYGHAVRVVEARGLWMRVESDDGYTGWVHAGYLRDDVTGASPSRISLGGVLAERAGRRLAVPLGALVPADATVTSGEIVLIGEERARRFPSNAAAIVGTATAFFEGAPYQWGGVTPWGADCSGMTQSVFALHGVALPRDSSRQSMAGGDAGTDLAVLQPGDLLFFSDRDDGAITHVAIALGGLRIVHVALGRGGYAVENLRDLTDPYVTALVQRFRFARRMPDLS
ncbi:MAG: C40 family peptidase [Gemmatimonadaceae bacterium]